MPYALIAGLLGAVGYFVTFYICKFFFRSYFENRREAIVIVSFMASFVLAFVPTYWMQLQDDAKLREAGLTNERYLWLQNKIGPFVIAPQNKDLRDEIQLAGAGNFVLDGHEILWRAAKKGASAAPPLEAARWWQAIFQLTVEHAPEHCHNVLRGPMDSKAFIAWTAKIPEPKLNSLMNIFFELIAARNNTPRPVLDPKVIEGINAYVNEKAPELKNLVSQAQAGGLLGAESCPALEKILHLFVPLGPVEFEGFVKSLSGTQGP